MAAKTIHPLSEASLNGKRVLVRVDHNVETDSSGTLKNDEKIRATLPTIAYLLKKGAHVLLLTHVGRPKGKVDPQSSTKNVARRLQELLPKTTVTHLEKTVGSDVGRSQRRPSQT